jgi:hypothetical protein
MYLICIYVIGNEKKQILELFNMKLSKTIDQTRICKKSYDDPLGYFCMGFFFTCPDGQVTNKFHLDVSTCPGQSDNIPLTSWGNEMKFTEKIEEELI